MKLTTVLMIVCCLHVSAAGYSQNVTITEKNALLTKVLQQIRKQLGFQLLYDSELIKKSIPVTMDVVNMPLGAVLDKIFSDQPFTYSIYDKTILVKEKVVEPRGRNNIAVMIIEGTVNGIDGLPLPGVSVKIKGSTKTTATKADGRFSINAPEENTVLIFSCVGMITVERIAKQGMFVIMQPELNKLNDLVVVGYGTTKRKDLTGSVASVDVNEVKDAPFMSIDNALAGKAPGVQVIKADGSPGGAVRIRIRGGTSLLGTNDPLYVIDGIPVVVTNSFMNAQSDIVNPIEAANYGEEFNNSVSGAFGRGLNNLAGLNIADIESIDILKDASATAIYGSKAANGVVVITTKKGKFNTKPQLNVNYYAGFNKPIKEKVLNAEQYKSALKEAATNYIDERKRLNLSLTTSRAKQALRIINDPSFFGTADTDWLGLVLRTGFTQNADISVSGGGLGSRYYTSLNYTTQDGTLVGTDFNRLSGKINLNNEITKRFRVTTNLNYGFTKTNITSGVYGQALTAPPTFSPYNADGSYSALGDLSLDYRGFQNPVAVSKVTNRAKDYTLMGSLSGEYDILKDLKFKSTLSANYSNYNQLNYTPSYVEIGGFYGRESSQGGLGSQSTSNSLSTFIENTLTWQKEFNENHRLTVLAGTSWENNKMDFFSATGRGFPDDDYLNNLSSAAYAVSVRGANPASQNALLSFYLRANYIFKDKYLFTFTGRSDASSKFPPDKQVGFPSGAIGWRISQENFLKDALWIDEIKLRASVGRTGTQNIGDHLWRTLYSPDSYAGNNALVPTQLGNSNIKWESTTQQDLGLDFSFFKGRLGGTFGYYNKLTDGALLNLTPAPSSSYSSVIYNIATIRNRGLEFDVHGDFVKSKSFTWNGAFNISSNISKVINIQGEAFSDPNDRNSLNLGTSIVKEGEPLGLLYGWVSAGIIKTQAQLDAYKAAFPDYIYFQPLVNIGDLAYQVGDDADWKHDIIGKAAPKFFGGYTNIFTYKNFSLISLFTFSSGGKLMYQKDVSDGNISDLANRGVRVLDHYSESNPDSKRPRYLFSQTVFLSDENVYDASYVKLKSISLSYNLPARLTKKLKVNNLSIYATGTNLFTITKYPGPDPEVSDDPGSVIGGGRDVSTFPTVKSYTFGVRLGF